MSRLSRRTLALAAAGAAAALIPAGAVASHYADVSAPPTTPTSASQIQNIGQVASSIKAYYGDHTTAVTDPVPNSCSGDNAATGPNVCSPSDAHPEADRSSVALHQFSDTSAYAKEVAGITAGVQTYLAKEAKQGGFSGRPAILFDVDDTTLNTYSYEIYGNFGYNSKQNADFVNAGSASVFPAVPTMPQLAAQAKSLGYDVYFLTGRPEGQRAGTKANLKDVGYGDVADDHLYLNDPSQPWNQCGTSACTTTQRKSQTRAHIESLGTDIVANLGDQYSDLNGGYADQTYKIPNPMYYLP